MFMKLTGLIVPLLVLVGPSAALFTVNCGILKGSIQMADPIVFPDQQSRHVHVPAGSTAFSQTESNEQAANGRATTCDKFYDKSSFWKPRLFHKNDNGTFNLVSMTGSAVYDLNRACDYDPKTKLGSSYPSGYVARAPSAGLRMVAGNPKLSKPSSTFVLLKNGSKTPYLSGRPCSRIRAETFFPSCCDGVNLDSSDHGSHMAFPIKAYNSGYCPKTHPGAIYSVFYEFFYDTAAYLDYNDLVWSMGDPTGYGLHGDFINGWNQTALDLAMTICTGPDGVNTPKCSLYVPEMKSAGKSSTQMVETTNPNPEPVGLEGPIPSLPGSNPIIQ